MAEMSNDQYKALNQNKGSGRTWIFVALGVLILGLGVAVYFNMKQSEQNEFIQAELNDTYSKLEGMNTELQDKIEEIEKLGGDVNQLRQIKDEMETEMEALKKDNQIAWAQYKKIQNKVEGYRELLIMKDEEIAKLTAMTEELLTENTDLKNEKNVLNDSISELDLTRQKLQEKVNMASRLKAENIKVYGVNRRGKERDGDLKARQIEQLKIEFNIAENEVAPIEGKDVLIRILEPEGNVLFDVARGSGTFMHNGKEEFYTAKQEILFDNTKQQLTFFYEKGGEFDPGQHKLEIYTDGYIMGIEPFMVK
ncbi:MAG: chromosome segregation protein SMC [Candidatus Cyclobacteriaceae bacterium M3_2C_046]